MALGYVLIMDLSTPNPFQTIVLAGAERMTSRNYTHEHGASAEIQVAPVGMPQAYEVTPTKAVLLLVSDSNGSLSAPDLIANDNEVDVIPLWEPAYHNRVRRDTNDGQLQHLARCNHACDRLAAYEVILGRQRELDFYTAHQSQPATRFYFSGSGLPLLGDPYEQMPQVRTCPRLPSTHTGTTPRTRPPNKSLYLPPPRGPGARRRHPYGQDPATDRGQIRRRGHPLSMTEVSGVNAHNTPLSQIGYLVCFITAEKGRSSEG